MKSCCALLLTGGLFAASVQAHELSADEYASAEKYIIESATDWAESVVTGGYSRRRIYSAQDFYGTSPDGERYGKAAKVRETGPSTVFVSNTINDITVKFFGETAIAYGDETWVKRDGTTGRFVWTDVRVRRNGSWQIVAAQDAVGPVNSSQ